ncbi:MAG: class I SAM-dependent methyltransferase [Thermomicrobiales bacterium]
MAITMAPTVEQFKEMVRQEWTDETTVAAWRRWKAPFAVQTAAMKAAIIAAARVTPGLRVLDIASGTGEPAVAIAAAVGPAGQVTATDLGPGMLAIAEEEARANGLTNLTFQQADAHALPFADQSFDRVTCRFGVMYFADSPTALREIHRVLKPGGRAAFIAWGLLDANPFMLSTIGPFFKRVAPPPPPPGAPTPFKFAQPGTLAAELRGAGFTSVDEETRTMPLPWPGPPEELWKHFYDIAAPFRPLIDGMPEAEREAAIDEVLTNLRHFYDGERTTIPASVIVASAAR